MKRILLPFLCGAVSASVVWAAAWSMSSGSAGPAPEPVHAVGAAPAEESVAPAPSAAEAPAEEPALVAPAVGGVPSPEAPAAVEAAPAPPPPPAPGEAREGERRERRGPPRWDEMTDEQREEMRQRFHRMADERAQRMADAFVERNGLAEADGETLLSIADGMNERAMERIQRWTDYLELQGANAIPKDQGARVMRDLFSDIVDGYAELDEAFGTDWREKDPDFDLGQMLSPEVWGSLFRLGGMGGPGGPGGPRGPGGGRRGPPRGPGGPGGSGGAGPAPRQ
jgi:hypothetical protein